MRTKSYPLLFPLPGQRLATTLAMSLPLLMLGCKDGDGAVVEADTDTDSDADTDSDTDADTDSDTDADTDSDTDTDTDSDTDPPGFTGLAPDWSLLDGNDTSLTFEDPVSPRDQLQKVSGWYFTHAT